MGIVTVCVFVCHMFSYHPFYFDFHSAHIISDVSSGFYFWNINRTPKTTKIGTPRIKVISQYEVQTLV
jgi:hypothetical protein